MEEKKKIANKIISAIFIAIGGIYLLNPTAGFIEFLPDNIPIIGNLDEAVATLLVVDGLKGFGIDITKVIERIRPVPSQKA